MDIKSKSTKHKLNFSAHLMICSESIGIVQLSNLNWNYIKKCWSCCFEIDVLRYIGFQLDTMTNEITANNNIIHSTIQSRGESLKKSTHCLFYCNFKFYFTYLYYTLSIYKMVMRLDLGRKNTINNSMVDSI